MGKNKKQRGKKFARVKKMIDPKDSRLKVKKDSVPLKPKKEDEVKTVAKIASSMYLKYNSALGPPYQILIDTNFVNFSIQNKLDIFKSLMDCLLAKCTPIVTDCVMAELEKLGQQYKVAMQIVKDPRFERVKCDHKGTYADDCLVNRVTQHKCYIVATCDKDLKRRIRKIPGVPIMFIQARRYSIERFPNLHTSAN